MNADRRLLRNAIRLDGLPSLERATGRELIRTVARTADLIRRDEHELTRQAATAFDHVAEDSADGWDLDAAALATLPRAISSRVVRATLLFVAGFTLVFVALGATASTIGDGLAHHRRLLAVQAVYSLGQGLHASQAAGAAGPGSAGRGGQACHADAIVARRPSTRTRPRTLAGVPFSDTLCPGMGSPRSAMTPSVPSIEFIPFAQVAIGPSNNGARGRERGDSGRERGLASSK